MKHSIFKSEIFYILSGIFSLVLIAFLISSNSDNILIPSFSDIIKSLKEIIFDVNFWKAFFKTLKVLLITITFSLILAILLSIPSIKNNYLERFLSPYLILIKCSPLIIVSTYLFFINKYFGVYAVIFLSSFPILFENIISAINEIPLQIKLELKTTNVSQINKYMKVYLPLILPQIVSSLLLTISIGFKASIMGEYLMSINNSLGEYIYICKTNVEYSNLLAILLLIVTFLILIDIISKKGFKIIKNILY